MNAARLLFLLCLFPLHAPAQQARRLESLTDASWQTWLTGSQWQGTREGRGLHLWFPTPRMILCRWEVSTGVWDSRLVVRADGEKGKVRWRWSSEIPASCTGTVANDLSTLTLEDALLGKWTLAPVARKAASVTGGRVSGLGAAGFSAWLEKQGLRWRMEKLNFGSARTTTYSLAEGHTGAFEIVSPGVVEVYPAKDRSEGLLVLFTPSLEAATVYAPWGVTAARVKGAPATAALPSPVFNDPAPAAKTLSAMSREQFAAWFSGTEWEHSAGGNISWYWHPVEGFITHRSPSEHAGFGSRVTAPGKGQWCYGADPKKLHDFTVAPDLATATYVWDDGRQTCQARLIARRMPFQMNVPPADRMPQLLQEHKVDMDGDVFLTAPSSRKMLWHEKGSARDLHLSFTGPGMFLYTVPENHWDRCLFVMRGETAVRIYWRWGGQDKKLIPADGQSVAGTAPATGGSSLFDMGLQDTKSIPLKNPGASVNALVVMDLDGGREAGALSRLTLTSLPQTADASATLEFNQPVGSMMRKALREVTRFHAIRQGGWPRAQRMELTFADKYTPKDGPSAAVACALLLESALRGTVIQKDFAVTGDMNADGAVQPIGGVAAKLRGATKGGCTSAAIPEKNAVHATDLALTDGAAPFLGIQVFTIATFDEAAKLAAQEDATLREAMSQFSGIAQKVRATPSALRQPETVSALRDVLQKAPAHLSARLLLAIAESKLPDTLSPAGSLGAVELAVTEALESTLRELLAASNLDRGKVAAARASLQQLRPKLDKRVLPLADAWTAWCQNVERIAASPGKPPAKLLTESKAAAARIEAEKKTLQSNADFREDLMK